MLRKYQYKFSLTVYLIVTTESERSNNIKQESPAIADKPARRESLPKLLQFDVLTTLSLTILACLIRLAVVASEIPRNALKIQTYGVQGHPRSSILVSMESPYVTSY